MKALDIISLKGISAGAVYEVYSTGSGASASITVNGNIDAAIAAKKTANSIDPSGNYTVRFVSK